MEPAHKPPYREPPSAKYDVAWGAVALILTVCACGTFFTDPIRSQTYAAWSQAVGAIVAIVGAYVVGERQGKVALTNAVQLDTIVERKRIASILAIAKAANSRAKSIGQIFAGDEVNFERYFTEYHPSILESLSGALSAIPVHQLGSADAAIAMLDLRDSLGFLQRGIATWYEGRSNPKLEERGMLRVHDQVGCANVRMFVAAVSRHFALVNIALTDIS